MDRISKAALDCASMNQNSLQRSPNGSAKDKHMALLILVSCSLILKNFRSFGFKGDCGRLYEELRLLGSCLFEY